MEVTVLKKKLVGLV